MVEEAGPEAGAGAGGTLPSPPMVCRICLEEYSEQGGLAGASSKERHLLNPCKCQGTQGLVHFGCLKRWLEFQVGKGSSLKKVTSCAVCKASYTLPPGYQMSLSSVSSSSNLSRLPSHLVTTSRIHHLRLVLTHYLENLYIINTAMRVLAPLLVPDQDVQTLPASSVLLAGEALEDPRLAAVKSLLILSVPFLPPSVRGLFSRLMEVEGFLTIKHALISGPFLAPFRRFLRRAFQGRRRPPAISGRAGA